MALDDSDPKQETPPEARERKLSTSSEPRLRTRSFTTRLGEVHTVREYVGDGMDGQLKELDLVKKTIPADNTSIFRAVCEQISSVQTDHHELRLLVEKILDPIARRHYANKESEFNRDRSRFEILAEITNSCIKVYRFGSAEPSVYEGIEAKENRVIQVCETPKRGVYDSVYSAKFHEGLAISQSITYRMLYEGVFKCSKSVVDEMITFIRRDNDTHSHSTLDQIFMLDDHHMHSVGPCSSKPPKFPFCACKSLDPTMYRNVEYSLYKKKTDESVQATMNSMAVKYARGTRCQAREGNHTGIVRVIAAPSSDVRRVIFEDNPQIVRDFNVSDLRPLAAQPVTHNSMQSLMSGTGRGGGRPPIGFLPGCAPAVSMAAPFPFPPPAHFLPHPPAMGFRWDRAAPPPSPFYSPPLMYGQQFSPPNDAIPPLPQQVVKQEQPQPPSPPPTPVEKEKKRGYSPAPVDSPLDNSVFHPSTPLSSRKGEEGGKKGFKKPRAVSDELTDSPTTTARSKKSDLPWNKQQQQQLSLKEETEKKRGARRATEGENTTGECTHSL